LVLGLILNFLIYILGFNSWVFWVDIFSWVFGFNSIRNELFLGYLQFITLSCADFI